MAQELEIQELIYEINGKQVMLDSDLAALFECVNETKSINQAVKRNSNKFLVEFCFNLSAEDINVFWSQIGTEGLLETRGGKYKAHMFLLKLE